MFGETKADLHNNRGQVYRFLEDYEKAVVDYSLSLAIDPEYVEPKTALDEIVEMIAKTKALIDNKGNLKAKKLKQFISQLPEINPTQPTLTLSPIAPLSTLKAGLNVGTRLSSLCHLSHHN